MGFTGSLKFPDFVTYIDDISFSGCYGFKGELIIPSTVEKIGSSAFYNCYGLTGSLILPTNINFTLINFRSFYNCSGLKSLSIPENVVSIDSYAFYGCSGFDGTLIIPEFVKEIGESSFLLTHFSKVVFNGALQPSCELNIGFPDGQIIYITDKYHDNTFCSYETELLPSLNSSIDESEKSKKIGNYAIILAGAVFAILAIITLIVIIVKRKTKDSISLDNEKLIEN